MNRLVPGFLAAASVVAFVVAIATVQTEGSSDACFTEQGEAAITACTQAISSRRFSGEELATIYANRAIELRERGEFDKAITDYSEALRINSALSDAYTGRGLAFEGKGNVERAKADYRKALTLTPTSDGAQWAHKTARQRLAALGGHDVSDVTSSIR